MPQGGGSVSAAVGVRTVTLTVAQILALGTTPVEIVPAPGSGKILLPLFAMAVYHPGTIVYDTFVNVGVGWAAYLAVVPLTNALDGSRLFQIAPASADVETLVAVENMALLVGMQTASPQNGNGTLTASVTYSMVSL